MAISLPHDHGQSLSKQLDQMPAAEEFDAAAVMFKLLGDRSRLRIFWVLCHCEECVINLSAIVGMSSPAVSHHLKQLRASGLIVSRREGKEVYYQSAPTELARQLHRMIEKTVKITCPIPAEEASVRQPGDPV